MFKRHSFGAVVFLTAIAMWCCPVVAQECCQVPTSESTQYTGDAGYVGAAYVFVGQFRQTLGPSSILFGGETVEEQGAIGLGVNGCNWANSGLETDPQPSGGQWIVSGDNHWQYDNVGADADRVNYVRSQGPPHGLSLPCTIYMPQNMVIWCSYSTDWNYASDTLSITVDADLVKNCRAGVCGTIYR